MINQKFLLCFVGLFFFHCFCSAQNSHLKFVLTSQGQIEIPPSAINDLPFLLECVPVPIPSLICYNQKTIHLPSDTSIKIHIDSFVVDVFNGINSCDQQIAVASFKENTIDTILQINCDDVGVRQMEVFVNAFLLPDSFYLRSNSCIIELIVQDTTLDCPTPLTSEQKKTEFMDKSLTQNNKVQSSQFFMNSLIDSCLIDSLKLSKTLFTCNDLGINNVNVDVYQDGTAFPCELIVEVIDRNGHCPLIKQQATIPTLSQWGIILLLQILLICGVVAVEQNNYSPQPEQRV